MYNVLIISHGDLAEAMLESAAMICGAAPEHEVTFLGLFPGDSPESFEKKILDVLSAWAGKDVLVLSDLRSGTPFNVAARLMQSHRFQHISGVNLALVIEALMSRDMMSVEETAETLREMAPETIMDVSQFFED